MNRNTKPLSPVVWDLLAFAGIAATVFQTALLITSYPATPFVRFAFALTGVFSVACIRRSPLLAKLWEWHQPRLGWFVAWSFCLVFLAAILFPVFAKSPKSKRNVSDTSKLKRISLAIQQYAQDYDGLLPLPGNQQEIRTALAPYLNRNAVWKTNQDNYFVINNSVMGSSTRAFSDLAPSIVLAYSPTLKTTPQRSSLSISGFLNYRVDEIPETRFDWLLLQSQTEAAKSARFFQTKPETVAIKKPVLPPEHGTLRPYETG